MAVIVTGGAGFIGSCVVRMLNETGTSDIIVVDDIACTDKWKNLVNKKYTEYIHKSDFLERLSEFAGRVTHIIHMGACSATTERDFDYLYRNNFLFTKKLWKFCTENNVSFIYASSAATYGNGEKSFDDEYPIDDLQPLNGYFFSKNLFYLWAERQEKKPPQHVGFKFFNVYGPNEYYKGSMASVILRGYCQIQKEGKIKLFKSYNRDFLDGGQKRDFIYVKDICKVIRYVMDFPEISGLFNLGTGQARTFLDLGRAVFSALGRDENIEFIDMPEELKAKYQYFTQAPMEKLQNALYKVDYRISFNPLEEGVRDYVQNYLEKDFATW